jgi:ABC-type uncharacterized transport system auxiliary subunit
MDRHDDPATLDPSAPSKRGTPMMRRRSAIAGLAALSGCSVLPSQPYAERREWPLVVRRPSIAPPARRGEVMLVRTVQAAPGLAQRGLQTLQADGSLRVDFYEQWTVPPAQAVETDLRAWLGDSGLFTAVVGAGSRLTAGYALEAELLVLLADLPARQARASLSLVLLDQRSGGNRILLQATERGTAPLTATDPPALVEAMKAALADLLTRTEQATAAALPGGSRTRRA